MGWSSAVNIFDTALKAVEDVLKEIKSDYSDHIPQKEMLIKVARPLAEELDMGDWDTHQESDYWEILKWHLWPEEALQEQEDFEEMDNV